MSVDCGTGIMDGMECEACVVDTGDFQTVSRRRTRITARNEDVNLRGRELSAVRRQAVHIVVQYITRFVSSTARDV